MVERLAVNQLVAGSSPAPSALGIRRKVKKLDTISRDMWGKTGRITDIRDDAKEPQVFPPGYPEWLKRRDSSYRKSKPVKYFLRFWVPNRCVGLWLTEEDMEEV